jgi:hypothetical protein
VSGSGTTWLVTVNTGTGNGSLGLRLDNSSGLADAASNPVVDFGTTGPAYSLDRQALLAQFGAVEPALRNTALPSVTLSFGKPISGLELADLRLTRNGGPNLITNSVTLRSSDNQSWLIENLADLTAAEGDYILTLVAAGSGIEDGATNPLAADATLTFTIDTTAPSVQIETITPDPRNTAVALLTMRFSEPMQGLDLADLHLSRDGGANLLDTSLSLSTTDNQRWTLGNLSGLTTSSGAYRLTLATAGISDMAGNQLAADATVAFVVDTTPPAATIAPVTPNPRNSAVNEIAISFSEVVTGFTLADLQLSRDGQPLDLSGASLSGSGNAYQLTGLEQFTGSSGIYTLSFRASGSVRDRVGNGPVATASASFRVDATPPLASIVPVTPAVRGSSVPTLTIRFSEPVTGFDMADLELTRNGQPVALDGASLRSDDGQTWTLNGLARATSSTGSYTMTLRAAGSDISDGLGNQLASDASSSFVFNRVTLYLPLVTVPPNGPDLVARVRLTPNKQNFQFGERVQITVEVTNQGDVTSTPFWVDLLINPQQPPAGPNVPWQTTCNLRPCYGLAWLVKRSLAPGERIVLTSDVGSYDAATSVWPGYFTFGTTTLFAVVDSWNDGVATGAVQESDERNNIARLEGLTVVDGGGE